MVTAELECTGFMQQLFLLPFRPAEGQRMMSACSEALRQAVNPICWRTARVSQILKSTKWWPALFGISPQLLIGFGIGVPTDILFMACWEL